MCSSRVGFVKRGVRTVLACSCYVGYTEYIRFGVGSFFQRRSHARYRSRSPVKTIDNLQRRIKYNIKNIKHFLEECAAK